MRLYKITMMVFLSLFITNGFSQNRKIKKATKDYENFSYIKTSDILLEVANKGFKSVNLFQKLGNSFYFNNRMDEAVKWYEELMSLNKDIDPEYYFRYAHALKYIENYKESDKWMRKFYEVKSSDSRAKAFITTIDYLSKIDKASGDFEVNNMPFNSDFSDFGTSQYKNQLIFASTRRGGKIYNWNNQPFLDLFSVEKQQDGTYSKARSFIGDINTQYHESTASFTPDEKFMFFTRNNATKRQVKKDEFGITRLKLFRTRIQDNGDLDEIESVHFNSNKYSVAHPTVNIYGNKLYFVSDMPGTIGQSDLYVVDINGDGTLGNPINLGNQINTEGHETFPFINSNGDLYFSSDGFTGLGGLDIFVIKDFENRRSKHLRLIVENIGRPINSSKDDFGYYENSGTEEGFFTSNRDGGKGDDDIYSFNISKCKQVVKGVIKDRETLGLLSNSVVILFDELGNKLGQMKVGVGATFKFEGLDCEEKEFLIRGKNDMYVSVEKRFTIHQTKQKLIVELLLEKDKKEIVKGMDLAKILNIPLIFFDLNKSDIRPEAEIELQKIIVLLKKHPDLHLEVRSHTDSRATYKYNDDLSNRRNESTINYIVERGGINKDRLTGKGYGERNLLNKCKNGVKCSELQHQLNRRSEFIVVQ